MWESGRCEFFSSIAQSIDLEEHEEKARHGVR